MRVYPSTISMVFLLLLCSCQLHKQPQHHVTFAALSLRPLPDRTQRIYLDALGQLYPPQHTLTDKALTRKSGSYLLKNFYVGQGHNQLLSMCLQYGLPTPNINNVAAMDTAWRQVQGELLRRQQMALNTQLQAAGPSAVLVVLIHGFNVNTQDHTLQGDTPPLYEAVRAALTAANPTRFANAVVLEVYWDGLQKKIHAGIWAAAQLNARYAGIQLRQLLAATPTQTPIRVFTHSSGAIVATHTFWNVQSIYPACDAISKTFTKEYKKVTPNHPDVRLGLLVPATGGNAFFGANPPLLDYNQRTPSSGNPVPRHVVIGQNLLDYALNKAGFSSPSRHGVTTLGSRQWDYERVEQAIGKANIDSIQFWNSQKGCKPWLREEGLFSKRFEAHGWETYLLPVRQHNFHRFVRLVMQ